MSAHDVTNERHRDRCAMCAAAWEDLERISRAARALPTLTPSRDLWAGIDARLSATRPGAVTPGTNAPTVRARRGWYAVPAFRLAAAASLLIAATATLTWQVATRSAADTGPFALSTDESVNGRAGEPGAASGSREASYESDFGDMDREIRSLEALVATQHGQLDPATVTVLERNLAVIDRAIAESRAAFLRDPASRFLATQLTRRYTSKLTLLRDMAKLPTGI